MIDELVTRREFLTKAIVSSTLGLGSIGAVGATRLGTLPIDVEIVNKGDDMKIQRVSTLVVRVRNRGTERLRLSFSTLREGLQTRFYWDVGSEQKTIAPGSTATFQLQASNAGMAIQYNEQFVLAIENEGASQGKVINGNVGTPSELTPIRNPSFDHWLVAPRQGTLFPFRWTESTEQREGDQVEISQTNRGARLSATRGNHAGPWTMSGLTQRVPSLEQIQLSVIPTTLTSPDTFQGGIDCGLEVIDRNHRLWIVYADTSDRVTRYYRRGDLDYHVVYIPATRGEQITNAIDLGQIYAERGWSRPREQPLVIDGIEYTASTMILHPFAAAYASEGHAEINILECRPIN